MINALSILHKNPQPTTGPTQDRPATPSVRFVLNSSVKDMIIPLMLWFSLFDPI